MKIILSRKGFDSSYGGAPSPIFPDGRIISLPIPETLYRGSELKYKDIITKGIDLAKLIENLNLPLNDKIISLSPDAPQVKLNGDNIAHLDPDLIYSSRPREKGWRGLLGQDQAAQGHLNNKDVDSNDLFIFYGLYQKMITENGLYRFAPESKPIHLIWGWLQVESVVKVADFTEDRYPQYSWIKYHPHFQFTVSSGSNNSVYIAREHLDIDGLPKHLVPGYGVFNKYNLNLQLTDPDVGTNPNQLRSYWRLPEWMHTNRTCPLSYNGKQEWEKKDGYARLKSFPRGQEFVMDCKSNPQAIKWITDLIVNNRD